MSVGENIPSPSAIRCNAQIRHIRSCGAARARCNCTTKTPKMSFSRNWTLFWTLCSKSFHDSPIHILCSSSTEIVHRQVDETMRCTAEKSWRNTFFSATCCARPVQRATNVCRGVPRDPTSPRKISSQLVRICRSYSQKVISYEYSIMMTTIDVSWRPRLHYRDTGKIMHAV